MNIHIEVLRRVIKALNLPIEETKDESGNQILQANDKINIYGAYATLIDARIENRIRLIEELNYQSNRKFGIEKLYAQDEIYKLKQELIDFHAEFCAAQSYIDNYEGRIEIEALQIAAEFKVATEELPALHEEAKLIVANSSNVFDKLTTLLYGLVLRCDNPKVYLNSESAVNQTYKELKRALADYHKLHSEEKTEAQQELRLDI